MDLSGMRESYQKGELDENNSSPVPMRLFEKWFADAVKAKITEPNAMTLATVGPDLQPSTRVVLMKGTDPRGVVFYTNYSSRKANEMANNPRVGAQFFWPELERVVRIEGVVERVSPEESDAYFAKRPIDSRIGAWASPQSQVISSRAVLLSNAAKVSARYGLHPPRPDHWGGYRILPSAWEFWQGRTSRLHDRIRYRFSDGSWLKERLAP